MIVQTKFHAADAVLTPPLVSAMLDPEGEQLIFEDGPDLDVLLAPLPDGAGGVGDDLRTSPDSASSYLTLKDLRVEARAAEREASSSADSDIPVLEAGSRYWRELVDLAYRVLERQSKDLEVAGWLCEGLVRTAGFTGLSAGLDLLARLVETYWDGGLYPTEDEDGAESRVAPVAGLLGMGGGASLVQPIKLLPLSDRGDEPVALWTVERAYAVSQGADEGDARERAQARKAEQIEQIKTGISRSSPGFLRALHRDVEASLAHLQRLVAAIDERTGLGRFGSQVADPLRAIVQILNDHAGAVLAPEGVAADLVSVGVQDGAPLAGGGQGQQMGVAVGAVGNRADAYAAILRIANFFDQTEPQSLVGRSLRDVVRRAQLPLDELLAELLPDMDQRLLFLLRAGVKAALPETPSLY